MKAKLSKALQTALDEFDKAAQSYGWESDHGSEHSAQKAEQRYLVARGNLYEKILQLQQRLRATQAKVSK